MQTKKLEKEDSRDFTKGSVESKLINFTIPIIIGNILMQLYNYTDSVIVGQFLGKEALAAVGASAPILFLLVSVVIGVSMGSSIMIGQYFGKGESEGIRKATDSLYIFLICAAVVVATICLVFNEKIMVLIGLPESIIPQAVNYLDITVLGLIFLFLFNGTSAVLRGVGDSKTPLIMLVASSLVNIVLDLIFIVWLKMGVEGAAWATVSAQFLAVIFAFQYVKKKNETINTNLLRLKFDRVVFTKSIKIGLPAAIQHLFVGVGMLAIISVIAPFGTSTIAGYSAAARIEAFVAVIPTTLSMAITSFTAQNYGAGLSHRVIEGLRSALKISIIASTVVMVLLSGLATPLIEMFSSDQEVVATGVRYLYVLAPSFYLFSVMFTLMGALRGIGNTVVPMFISIASLWAVRIPLAKLLSNPLGELGIWVSATASWTIGCAIAAYYCWKLLKKN